MSYLPKAVDTICIFDDAQYATITSRINEKYARKLLQDWLKATSGIKGYWTCWLITKDETKYTFKLDNPIREATRWFKEMTP